MFDLNAILSAALTAAVAEATKPLHEAVQALAARIEALENRLTDADVKALETNTLSPDDLVQVKQRIEALVLDQQEWFWEKFTRKAAEAAESAVEEALNDHCTTYDHDDYDNVASTVDEVDLDNVVTMDNLSDEIRRTLREATISIDF